MSSQLPLRDYQRDALDAVLADWYAGVQRPAVVAPTGAGKTVMFAHLIQDHLDHHARATTNPQRRYASRAVVLVHRDELADQAMAKIRQVSPELRVGKVKAGDNQVNADVVVASVQTLARKKRLDQLLDGTCTCSPVRDTATEGHHPTCPYMPLKPVGLVVVDECHHAVAPTWKTVLERLGCFGGSWTDDFDATLPVECVGFSATLARGDGIGLGTVWEKISYAVSLTRLIRRGFLVDPRGVQVRVEDLDLDNVRRTGGDYSTGALGDALHDSDMAETVAKAYLEHAADRPGVAFTPTVATAHDVADALNNVGIATEVISGETPREDRQLIYKRYASGETQVLSNCMVLTEGFDAPWASCAVIARPTQSAPLYTQMVGRVLRPWTNPVTGERKKDALVLDVVGASTVHKLATLIDLAPGAVSVIKPDQSLLDAIEEEELAALETEREREEYARQSRLTAREVDLFAASKNVWLRTVAGVWFIPTRDGEIFLWPAPARGGEPGTWDVAHAPVVVEQSGRKRSLPWQRLHEGLGLELAMSWAQTEAEERDPSVASKDASWRRSGGKASDAQKAYVRRFMSVLPNGRDVDSLKKSEASDIISIGLASQKFDKHYQKVSS